MDLNRKPAVIAFSAAEEIRALNHRTLGAKAFEQPGDVSDAADSVATLLERLPQALDQLAAGLIVLQNADKIRLDSNPLGATTEQDIAGEVATVTSALSETRRLLRQAHRTMREATGPLSHMGGLWEDPKGDEEE